MDIHPPEGPMHSLREFATHIAVVTVGILIALSLEGVRETFREHTIVREARENFRVEAEGNHGNVVRELENTRNLQTQIAAIVHDLPELEHDPAILRARIEAIQPSFYFFSSARWESALSTGALGHMSPDEVSRYSSETFLVHSYTNIENEALPLFISLQAYFHAHRTLNPAEVDTGMEKLIVFGAYVKTMTHVGEQLSGSIDEALRKP